jgi:N-acetylglucosamine kinase-like BadF-type ATPase
MSGAGPVFVGIDGGQSSTTAIIGDAAGRVLGSGRGGPCNHVGGPAGRVKFTGAISTCVVEAARQAGLPYPGLPVEILFAGFSGGAADKHDLLEELVPARRTIAVDDAVIALTGANGGAPGIITIAGTGSISRGRNAAGKLARSGGWGYVFGDEGGGFDLARQALRAALRWEEGWGPATALHGLLLEATGSPNANHLMHSWYTAEFPRPRIAGFSKLVDQAAVGGDAVAGELLHAAAQQLAALTAATRSQIFEANDTVRVAYLGGVFRSRMLLERFRTLVELAGTDTVGAPVYGPAAGALLEAYAAAGIRVARLENYSGEKLDS